MARAVVARLIHCAEKLLLLVLWICPCAASPTGVGSLCYNFTVHKSESGQWLNGGQGLLNKKVFLDYNRGSNCKIGSLPENRINATQMFNNSCEFLKDASDLFKEKLLNLETENNTIREPLSLQVTMFCQAKGDGHTYGYWVFSLNRQKMFHFDSGSRKWTEPHPVSTWIKDKWENDKDLSDFLWRSSVEGCKEWPASVTAPPTTTPDMVQRASTAITTKPCVPLIPLTCSLLLLILRQFFTGTG
ncbi:UL16-binding protein 6 [Nannospalax galili]|uniref:UL16-binding protein 6 n=1 Tax=Nannospalax galili TaxID=1026970 RepID=UPI0004ED18F4|nr:UL16-binding protein 6 [Nannospalax galili]